MHSFFIYKSICYITLVGLFAVSVQAQEKSDFPGVEQLMTAAEFKAAGLHQLSDEELIELNQWLTQYTATEAPVVRAKSKTVKKAQKEEKVSARIVGRFEGWRGETVFKLDNGQVWKQRLKGRHDANLESPEVLITRNWLGHYRMEIVASGRSVGVERIK